MGEELTLEECFFRTRRKLSKRCRIQKCRQKTRFALYEQGMKIVKKTAIRKIDAVEKKMLKMNEQGELEEF